MSKSKRAPATVRLIVAVIATALLAACTESTTGPTARRNTPAPGVSQHDVPPDSTCLSGWIQVDGRWVCG